MTHIPVQKINDANYSLPEKREKEWIAGVLFDKPLQQLELPNQPEKRKLEKIIEEPK